MPLPTLPNGFDLAIDWNSDAYAIVHGGVKRGHAVDSVLTVDAGLDTAALGGWKGGHLLIGLQAITSTHPSAYAGDLQTLSNLDARNRRNVAKFWYSQQIGRSLVRGGIMDMNAYFNVNDAAGLFPNSSFGIIPSISVNVPTSIYPDYGWGLMARIGKSDDNWRIGLFQGDPQRRSSALHDGATLIAERGWRSNAGSHLGIGAWYRRAPATTAAPGSDWGVYANLEHALPAHPNAVAFVQLGASPGAANTVPGYVGAGIHIHHVSKTISDLGFGMARAWIRNHTAETSLEATALIPIGNGSVDLQPDVQYILHPSGTHPNALAIGLRLHLTLY